MSQTPAILVERGLQPSYPARRIWRAWWALRKNDGSQFKAKALSTLIGLEAKGTLHQIGDAPKIVDRVRQQELGESSGLTRSTQTKRISLLAGPDPLWTPEKREKQSKKMKRVASRHPHWKGGGSTDPSESRLDKTASVNRDAELLPRSHAGGALRPGENGGGNVHRTEDQRSRVECDPNQAADGALSSERVSGIQAAQSAQSGCEDQSGISSASAPWLLVRNSGFATPNSYALGTKDLRPGLKAESDPCAHARWLASHFGAHLFDPKATAPGGGSLNGFRKDMGFWSAPELPDAPDCECIIQRSFEERRQKAPRIDSDDSREVATLQSGDAVDIAGDPSPDLNCPKCGGCGYTIGTPTEENGYKGTMGDYDRLVGRWLNDRGIDQEIRWCKSCKRSYSQDNAPHYPQCPGCNSGAESEVRKHRGILEGYSMQEIADANGLHVSTVQRIFKVFRRLMLIRTVYGKKWRQCQMCRGAWYDAKECPKCGNKCGEIKASEKAKHLWLPVRYMDKWLALAEKQRLEALVERQERLHLVPEQMNALKLAVAAAMGLLYQWEGHEHQLQSFYNELRRRLDTDHFRRFLNLLFPLPLAFTLAPAASESPPNTS